MPKVVDIIEGVRKNDKVSTVRYTECGSQVDSEASIWNDAKHMDLVKAGACVQVSFTKRLSKDPKWPDEWFISDAKPEDDPFEEDDPGPSRARPANGRPAADPRQASIESQNAGTHADAMYALEVQMGKGENGDSEYDGFDVNRWHRIQKDIFKAMKATAEGG